MEYVFVNGPLDSLTVDVGNITLAVIDVCTPVDGSQPELFKMIIPNNGMWRYAFDEASQTYIGEEYILGRDLVLTGISWTAFGKFRIWNPNTEDITVSASGQAVVLPGGWKVVVDD